MDRDAIQMLRAGKDARDEQGITDERADLVLAVYEAGMTPPLGATIEDLRAAVADPANARRDLRADAVAQASADQRTDNGAPRVRRGGEAASNQFGTFSVHQASDKQIGFAKRLLAERDLTGVKIPTDIDTISKTACSALIDRLMACPVKAGAPATGTGPRRASDKQMAFLRKLIAERDYHSLGADDRAKVDALNANANAIPTSKGASDLIDVLTKTAYATTKSAQAGVEAGVYVNADGKVYRVYLGQQSGRMLAALVVEHSDGTADFEYAGAASRFITATSRKMTIDEAARFGKATGTCIVCARRLDVPESVDRGIGPVCFAKMGG